MNVYLIECLGEYSRNYCVVAESYSEAERLWKEKGYGEPKSIRLFSEYVIIQETKECYE